MLHALESRGTWISSAKPVLGRSDCVITTDEHLVEWDMAITGGVGVPAAIDG
jgi:hypothetical protein